MDASILGSLISRSKQMQCSSLINDHLLGISDIAVSSFNEYVSTRRVLSEVNE